mmetsp:Transcript_24653/g.45954  ORF Transcript_24653/g.45954 Transcript_24653/m.45954 type:complete len:359 (-) Transcript_24653:8-1084(-)
MFLLELLLVLASHLHQGTHIDLLKSGKHGSNTLRLLQTLSDSLTHASHLHASFVSVSLFSNGSGSGGGSGSGCGLLLRCRGGGGGWGRRSILGRRRSRRSAGRGASRGALHYDKQRSTDFNFISFFSQDFDNLSGERRVDVNSDLVSFDTGNHLISRHEVAYSLVPGRQDSLSDTLSHDRDRNFLASARGRGRRGSLFSWGRGGCCRSRRSTSGVGVDFVKVIAHFNLVTLRAESAGEHATLLRPDVHGDLVSLHHRNYIILIDLFAFFLLPADQHGRRNRVTKTLKRNHSHARELSDSATEGSNFDRSGRHNKAARESNLGSDLDGNILARSLKGCSDKKITCAVHCIFYVKVELYG